MMAAVWGNLWERCTIVSGLSRLPGTLMRYNIGEREKRERGWAQKTRTNRHAAQKGVYGRRTGRGEFEVWFYF